MHERCLQIVHNDNKSWYKELLEYDNLISVRKWMLQALAVELHKITNGFSCGIIMHVFPFDRGSTYDNRKRRVLPSDH